jgi:large subunit ribosomal protein L15
MKIDQLSPARGSRKVGYRKGLGLGSGWGKTAGRGSKGAGSRSGATISPGFEGGQMPLAQRMPKRGFNNYRFRVEYDVVNLRDLAKAGTDVNPESLYRAGLVGKKARIKVLGTGEAPKGLQVKAHKFSKSAVEKLTAAGGKIEVLA